MAPNLNGKAIDAARMLTAALEGAMLLARSYNDVTRFADAATHVLLEFALPTARCAPGLTRSPSIRARRPASQGPGVTVEPAVMAQGEHRVTRRA